MILEELAKVNNEKTEESFTMNVVDDPFTNDVRILIEKKYKINGEPTIKLIEVDPLVSDLILEFKYKLGRTGLKGWDCGARK